MDGETKSNDLGDASFSYLTSAQQNLVLKLRESAQFPHPDLVSSQETSISISPEKAKPEEVEISVFGAEKYFNMKLDYETSGSIDATNAGKFEHEKIENQVEVRRLRTKGRFGTPSVSSESNWNSQTALLPNSRRNLSHIRPKKANERWFFPGFSCNGSCFDKKSVYIDTNFGHRSLQVARNPIMLEARKQSQSQSVFLLKDEFCSPSYEKMRIGSNRENYYVLPTLNSGVQNLKVTKEKQKTMEEDPRKSLEVFGSHQIKKEDIASNLERKLSVLTWDAIPFPKAQNLPTTSTSSQMYEDVESEASSDLFEIENISCSTRQPIFTKQNSDGMSRCMTPTSQYEPSETSIGWSVVTASAADFSAVSDYDEKKTAESNTNSAGLTSHRNRRPNNLLGCKNQKAVQVAETVHKRNDHKGKPQLHPQYRKSLDASMPVIRKLPANSKVKDFDFP